MILSEVGFGLYLYMAGFGWIQFDVYSTESNCEQQREYMMAQHSLITESMCLRINK